MKTMTRAVGSIAVALAAAFSAVGETGLEGRWKLDPAASSAVDPWRSIELNIEQEGDRLRVQERVAAGRRSAEQAIEVELSGEASENRLDWWIGNRHIGAFLAEDGLMETRAGWLDEGRTLRLESRFALATSQSETPVREYVEYRLSGDGKRLTRITLRSTRPLPVTHSFVRQ